MRTDLTQAWSLYQDVVAPAPVETGFVLASAVALWCVAYVADWAAFRLWVPFEATLPAGTLFLFTALLGTVARPRVGGRHLCRHAAHVPARCIDWLARTAPATGWPSAAGRATARCSPRGSPSGPWPC